MSFLGPVGSIIPVKCASRLTSSGGRQVSFQDTLSKRKAFLGKVTAREWDVDIGLAKPSELSGLRWLAENVNAPMVWYSPDAVVGNILTPAQADLTPTTHDGLEGPLVEVEPGVHVKSASPTGDPLALRDPDGALHMAPTSAGRQLTVSAWLRGNTLSGRQMIRVIWRNFSGANIGQSDTNFDVSSVFARRAATVTPPAGAVGFNVMFYAAQVAGPAVTMTDEVTPYSPGRGATKVIVHGLSDAVIRATETQQLGSLSFRVTEVG